jgi:hypothetical protein
MMTVLGYFSGCGSNVSILRRVWRDYILGEVDSESQSTHFLLCYLRFPIRSNIGDDVRPLRGLLEGGGW